MLDKIFPLQSFTETEENIIREALTNPAVVKYFTHMAAQAAHAIASGYPDGDMSNADEKFLRRVARTQGHLEVYGTLVNFAGEQQSDGV